MKVVQIIDSLTWGGAQKMQLVFAKNLADQPVELTLISLADTREKFFEQEMRSLGIPVFIFPSDSLLNLRRIWEIVFLLRKIGADILHAHLTYANIIGTLVGFLARIPTIATLRSAGIDQDFNNPWRYRLETWLLRFMSTRVMANGYAVSEANQKRLKGRNIDVIPNAISLIPGISEGERLSIRDELLKDPSIPLVISVGRLSAPKGYRDLIDAFALVVQKHPRTVLVIAGKGPYREEMEVQIDRLGLARNVTLLGSRDDVPRLLSASDIYVSSSHWEGMSVAIMEAMAAGLPVIATSVGDSPIVVTDQTGIIVQPHKPQEIAKALISLLGDPEKSKTLGKNARNHIDRNYSPASWVNRLVEYYSEICNPKSAWKGLQAGA